MTKRESFYRSGCCSVLTVPFNGAQSIERSASVKYRRKCIMNVTPLILFLKFTCWLETILKMTLTYFT